MTELIIEMVTCLISAILLGFIFGWLLSKTVLKKKHLFEMNILNSAFKEAKLELEEYKKEHIYKQLKMEKVTLRNEELATKLLDKSTLLESKDRELLNIKKELKMTKNTLNDNSDTKEHNHVLVNQIMSLEALVKKKSKESRGLEMVLLRADQIIEERNETLKELEEKLKKQENEEKGEKGEDLVISKDQFIQIENQLLLYQKEITKLKKANKILSEHKVERVNMEGKEGDKELDDLAIVKLFGNTYKKIIKS